MCDHPQEHTNHDHKCSCGTVWGHSECSLDCTECHTCPNCGAEQFNVHTFKSREEKIKFKLAQWGLGELVDHVLAAPK
jgi:hypothetical protein